MAGRKKQCKGKTLAAPVVARVSARETWGQHVQERALQEEENARLQKLAAAMPKQKSRGKKWTVAETTHLIEVMKEVGDGESKEDYYDSIHNLFGESRTRLQVKGRCRWLRQQFKVVHDQVKTSGGGRSDEELATEVFEYYDDLKGLYENKKDVVPEYVFDTQENAAIATVNETMEEIDDIKEGSEVAEDDTDASIIEEAHGFRFDGNDAGNGNKRKIVLDENKEAKAKQIVGKKRKNGSKAADIVDAISASEERMLKFWEKESQKDRDHELRVLQMVMGMANKDK